MRTPRNILRHELIGLDCTVVSSSNKSQVGISGKIVDETMKTLVIESAGKEKRVQKEGCVFRVSLGPQAVDIEGKYIASRPEDRIKKKFSRW